MSVDVTDVCCVSRLGVWFRLSGGARYNIRSPVHMQAWCGSARLRGLC